MNEKLADFNMEFTVPIKQIKTKFFFARIFDITLHVIISGIGMREKGEYRGIEGREEEEGKKPETQRE